MKLSEIPHLIEKFWDWFFIEKRPVGFLVFVVLILFCSFMIFDNWNLRDKLDLANVKTIQEIESKVNTLWEHRPRILSEDVSKEVISRLNLMPQKYKIDIFTSEDTESANFGRQIKEIFERANWTVIDIQESMFARPSELKLGFLCEDTENKDFQKAISPILHEFGYPYISNKEMEDRFINYSSVPEGQITIYVGNK